MLVLSLSLLVAAIGCTDAGNSNCTVPQIQVNPNLTVSNSCVAICENGTRINVGETILCAFEMSSGGSPGQRTVGSTGMCSRGLCRPPGEKIDAVPKCYLRSDVTYKGEVLSESCSWKCFNGTKVTFVNEPDGTPCVRSTRKQWWLFGPQVPAAAGVCHNGTCVTVPPPDPFPAKCPEKNLTVNSVVQVAETCNVRCSDGRTESRINGTMCALSTGRKWYSFWKTFVKSIGQCINGECTEYASDGKAELFVVLTFRQNTVAPKKDAWNPMCISVTSLH